MTSFVAAAFLVSFAGALLDDIERDRGEIDALPDAECLALASSLLARHHPDATRTDVPPACSTRVVRGAIVVALTINPRRPRATVEFVELVMFSVDVVDGGTTRALSMPMMLSQEAPLRRLGFDAGLYRLAPDKPALGLTLRSVSAHPALNWWQDRTHLFIIEPDTFKDVFDVETKTFERWAPGRSSGGGRGSRSPPQTGGGSYRKARIVAGSSRSHGFADLQIIEKHRQWEEPASSGPPKVTSTKSQTTTMRFDGSGYVEVRPPARQK
jgi:hypothetical protein